MTENTGVKQKNNSRLQYFHRRIEADATGLDPEVVDNLLSICESHLSRLQILLHTVVESKAESNLSTRVKRGLSHRFEIDTRSLALFRIIIGLLITIDAISRSRDFWMYYSDEGVVTPTVRKAFYDNPTMAELSVFSQASDPYLIAFLFVLYAFTGIALAIGFRTRMSTALGFILYFSLIIHNPLVISYADAIFVLLLLWAVLLPLGERWSIDAVHRDGHARQSVSGLATALILFQMVAMYLFNWLHKAVIPEWWSGEVAVLALGGDAMTFFMADFFSNYPDYLQMGGIIWFGILGVSLALIILTDWRRLLLITPFVGGHLAFALTVRIGTFPFVAIAGLILFIQPVVWEGGINAAERIGLMKRIEHVKSQCEVIANRFPNFSIIPLLDRRNTVERVSAVVEATPRILRISGKVCLIILAITAFVLVQPQWTVFTSGYDEDGYFVVAAETEDGDHIDIFNDRELSYERPYDGELQRQYDTYRDRFYMMGTHVEDQTGGEAADRYGNYLCETHEDDLVRVNVYAVVEEVTVDTVNTPDERNVEIELLNQYGCGENAPGDIDPPTTDEQ